MPKLYIICWVPYSNVWRQALDLFYEQLSFHLQFSLLLALKTNHVVLWLGLCESSSQLFLTFHKMLCAVERATHFPVPHLNDCFIIGRQIHLVCPKIPYTLIEAQLWHVVVDLGERPTKCPITSDSRTSASKILKRGPELIYLCCTGLINRLRQGRHNFQS